MFRILEREAVGRYLATSKAVCRGEVLLLEEPLFVSPRAEDLPPLQRELFEDGVHAASSELPLATQLFFAVLREMLMRPTSKGLEQFHKLRGHSEAWGRTTAQLFEFLREEHRHCLKLDEFSEAFAKVAANAHQTSDKRAAIFALGSLAEHSCRPTAFKTVETGPNGLQIVIRALCDLKEGEIISLAYVPEYYPTWRRQEQLKAAYNFSCCCERCLALPELVCAFVCPACAGPCCPQKPCTERAALNTLRCEDCGQEVQDNSDFLAAEACSEFCAKCAPFLHPYHFKIFQMYMSNLEAVPTVQCLQILEQLADAHERLSENDAHPLLSRLAEIAAEKTEDKSAWKRAAELYAISHGAGTAETQRCLHRAE